MNSVKKKPHLVAEELDQVPRQDRSYRAHQFPIFLAVREMKTFVELPLVDLDVLYGTLKRETSSITAPMSEDVIESPSPSATTGSDFSVQ